MWTHITVTVFAFVQYRFWRLRRGMSGISTAQVKELSSLVLSSWPNLVKMSKCRLLEILSGFTIQELTEVGDTLTVGKNNWIWATTNLYAWFIKWKFLLKHVTLKRNYKEESNIGYGRAAQPYTNCKQADTCWCRWSASVPEVFKLSYGRMNTMPKSLVPMGKKTVRWIQPEHSMNACHRSRNILAKRLLWYRSSSLKMTFTSILVCGQISRCNIGREG